MTQFFIPKRFDVTSASDGIWREIVDENGTVWGEFKFRLFDASNKATQVAVERHNRAVKNERKAVGEEAQRIAGARALVNLVLIDWKMNDAAGKPIAYNEKVAIEYFSHPETVFATNSVWALASDVTNFQPEEQTELPEGN